MSFFQALLTGGNNLYVSNAGAGDGSGVNAANAMTFADFLLATIPNNVRILFNRGETYDLADYDFTVPVKIDAYGSGADPIADSSEDISGLTWTDTGGGIYTTPMVTEPKWIWIDGECAKMAETARITILNRTSTTTATVGTGTLDTYTNIVGSYLVIKEKNFQNSQKVTITNFNTTSDVLTFDEEIPTTLNEDLVVYNDTEFLTGDNEWVWRSGTLYVKAAANPSTLDIRKTDVTYGIKTTDDLRVNNFEFRNYYTAAIWLDGGVPIITDCSFHDIRDNAVIIQRAVTGVSITDNTFERIGNNGIFCRPLTDSYILRNTFTDIGMQANYNWQTWFDGDGTHAINNIQVGGNAFMMVIDLDNKPDDGSNTTVEYNTITNVAYRGISFAMGTQNIIRYNIVTDFCNRFVDGGGIYTYHNQNFGMPNQGNDISYNFVSDNNGQPVAMGIYLDNGSFESNVHHNTISDCIYVGSDTTVFSAGVHVGSGQSDATVEYNNIINCSYGVSFKQRDPTTVPANHFYAEDNINNQLNFNNITSQRAGQKAIVFAINYSYPTWSPYNGTGGADNNVYAKNVAPGNAFIADSDIFGTDMTLADLQADYGTDASSIKVTFNGVLITNPTNAISNEDADSDYKDAAGSTLTTYTIDPYYSRIIYEINRSNTLAAASTQYFNAGTAADIQFTHTSIFSIAIRFKLPANPTPGNYALIDNRDSSGRGIAVVVNTSGFVVVSLVNTPTTNQIVFADNVDVADNAWHHILFVKKATASDSDLFVDGANALPSETGTLSATIASTENWNIGRRPNGTLYISGLVDDIAIWDTSHSPNIVSIYNGGREIDYNTIGLNKPIHYWRMGKAISLLDVGKSPTLLDLTAVNSPTNSTDAP